MAAIWSDAIKAGAWPMPGNSTKRALGPRRVIASASARRSKSLPAPRITSVGQRTASQACHRSMSAGSAVRNGSPMRGS